ncbi:MAG: response regulator [Candidatus Promineifilaceae bacterium]|nr:response regulator [Candidatus Promineifilaceae bacterium]
MKHGEEANKPFGAVEDLELYRSIFNTILDAILLFDKLGTILFINPAATNLFGYSSSELIGQSVGRVIPSLRPDWPEDFQPLSTAVGIDLEHSGLNKDGLDFPLRLNLSEITHAGKFIHVALARDDTANKMAEEMLQETLKETMHDLEREKEETDKRRSQIRAIVDTSIDAIALVAPDGTFLDIDTQFTEYFAITKDEISGRNWSDMVPLVGRIFEDPPAVLHLLAKTAPDKELEMREIIVQKWPQARELELTSRPVTTKKGRHLGRLYVFRDVTHEREVDRMKSQFVSMVSHELRTPLTSIKGFTEMILDEDAGEINEEQREFLGIVEANADRLIALVNDLLDVSRIESGRIELKLERADVNELMDIVVATMAHLVEDKSQTLDVFVDQNLPTVKLDRDRIIQVLTNLVSNAYKYTQAGGHIGITAERSGSCVRFAVADNGFGISDKDQEKLFTRFFRVDSTLTREIGGTGLGLNIVKSIIEMHGGEVIVNSELGVGSTFAFTLPLEVDGDEEQLKSASAMLDVSRQIAEGKTILIVEDEADITRLIRLHLEKAGYAVETASSGEEALARLRDPQQILPDLITLDIQLPGINGFDLAAIMANDPITADIPILVISIYGDDPRGARLGLVHRVAKPIDRDELLNTVAGLLNSEETEGKILIIGSAPQPQNDLKTVLKNQGYTIIQAEDGARGLTLAAEEQPGLILLNLKLPDMEGTEVLQTLKDVEETAQIPVIVASGGSYQISERAKALALGAADFMAGPFDMDILLEEVRLFIREED